MENLAKEIGENGPASSNSAALMVNDGLSTSIEGKRRVSTCSGYSIFTGKFQIPIQKLNFPISTFVLLVSLKYFALFH